MKIFFFLCSILLLSTNELKRDNGEMSESVHFLNCLIKLRINFSKLFNEFYVLVTSLLNNLSTLLR